MEIRHQKKQDFDYKMVIYYKMDVSKKTLTADSPPQNSSLVDEYEWTYYNLVGVRYIELRFSLYNYIKMLVKILRSKRGFFFTAHQVYPQLMII